MSSSLWFNQQDSTSSLVHHHKKSPDAPRLYWPYSMHCTPTKDGRLRIRDSTTGKCKVKRTRKPRIHTPSATSSLFFNQDSSSLGGRSLQRHYITQRIRDSIPSPMEHKKAHKMHGVKAREAMWKRVHGSPTEMEEARASAPGLRMSPATFNKHAVQMYREAKAHRPKSARKQRQMMSPEEHKRMVMSRKSYASSPNPSSKYNWAVADGSLTSIARKQQRRTSSL